MDGLTNGTFAFALLGFRGVLCGSRWSECCGYSHRFSGKPKRKVSLISPGYGCFYHPHNGV